MAYPLWVTGRRPGASGPRTLLVETGFALFFAPLLMLIMGTLTLALTRFLGLRESPNPFEPIAGSPELLHPLALVFFAVVVAPLAEETFFRGMFYNFLRQRMHFLPAALVSGTTFGLWHPFGFMERLGIAAIGFCLALTYQWRKTLVAPMLLHSLVNALAMSMLFYSLSVAANAPVLGVRGEAKEDGCLVTAVVADGAAEAAGIHVGDVITGAGENSVRSLGDLVLIMRMKEVGETIPVWFLRDGRSMQVEATLRARPE